MFKQNLKFANLKKVLICAILVVSFIITGFITSINLSDLTASAASVESLGIKAEGQMDSSTGIKELVITGDFKSNDMISIYINDKPFGVGFYTLCSRSFVPGASVSAKKYVIDITFLYEEALNNKLPLQYATNYYAIIELERGVTRYDESAYRFSFDAFYELPPAPTKEGYTFVGWYTNEALTITYKGTPITADTILYAKFEINEYTITFNTAGGNSIAAVKKTYNSVYNSFPTPTKTGYTFEGWYNDAGQKTTSVTMTEDITLTARWSALKFTVTFKVDGEIYATIEVPYGASLTEAAESIAAEIRSGITLFGVSSSDVVTSNLILEGELRDDNKTIFEKTEDAVKDNISIIGAVGGLLLIFGLLAAFGSKKKRSRG